MLVLTTVSSKNESLAGQRHSYANVLTRSVSEELLILTSPRRRVGLLKTQEKSQLCNFKSYASGWENVRVCWRVTLSDDTHEFLPTECY